MDSTAAAMLLPDDTILAYHERGFPSLLSHDSLRLFEQIECRWGRKMIIPQIMKRSEPSMKQVGFSTDYAAGTSNSDGGLS